MVAKHHNDLEPDIMSAEQCFPGLADSGIITVDKASEGVGTAGLGLDWTGRRVRGCFSFRSATSWPQVVKPSSSAGVVSLLHLIFGGVYVVHSNGQHVNML